MLTLHYRFITFAIYFNRLLFCQTIWEDWGKETKLQNEYHIKCCNTPLQGERLPRTVDIAVVINYLHPAYTYMYICIYIWTRWCLLLSTLELILRKRIYLIQALNFMLLSETMSDFFCWLQPLPKWKTWTDNICFI